MKNNLNHLKSILDIYNISIFNLLLVLFKGIEKLWTDCLEKVKIEMSNKFHIIANKLN